MLPQVETRNLRLTTETSAEELTTSYYDKSWGLVIGINDYGDQHPLLANARNDAVAFADLLRTSYKFEQVFTLYDVEATCDVLMEWLRDKLPAQIGKNDRLVIFFAGHGATRESGLGEKRGYLVPHDAQAGRYADYIDMSELRDACGWIRAKHILLILDCCFSGIAAIASRSVPPMDQKVMTDLYLNEITRRSAWQVLTAGASDELAADSGNRPGHSAFTSALLAGLEGQADYNQDGIITASELAGFIKPEVSRDRPRAKGQTPFFNYLAGSGQGDFVFLRYDTPVKLQTSGTFTPGAPRLAQWLPALLSAALVLLLAVGMWGGYVWPFIKDHSPTSSTIPMATTSQAESEQVAHNSAVPTALDATVTPSAIQSTTPTQPGISTPTAGAQAVAIAPPTPSQPTSTNTPAVVSPVQAPKDVIRTYFENVAEGIRTGNFHAAFALYDSSRTYESFAKGYASTRDLTLEASQVIQESTNSAIVDAVVVAADVQGVEWRYNRYVFRYSLTKASEAWRINGAQSKLTKKTAINGCPGFYATRLQKGQKAYVLENPPNPNHLYKAAGQGNSKFGQIEPGHGMRVLEGPRCINTMIWWYVQPDDGGKPGWTSEGNQTAGYWLAPGDNPNTTAPTTTTPITPTVSNTITSTQTAPITSTVNSATVPTNTMSITPTGSNTVTAVIAVPASIPEHNIATSTALSTATEVITAPVVTLVDSTTISSATNTVTETTGSGH